MFGGCYESPCFLRWYAETHLESYCVTFGEERRPRYGPQCWFYASNRPLCLLVTIVLCAAAAVVALATLRRRRVLGLGGPRRPYVGPPGCAEIRTQQSTQMVL